MKIRQKTPDKILISTAFLKSAIAQDRERSKTQNDFESSKNIFFALLGGLTSCGLSIPSWSTWNTIQKLGIGVISLIFIISTLWYLLKLIQSKRNLNSNKQKDLEKHIIDDAKKKIRYTALLIISTQDKVLLTACFVQNHPVDIVHIQPIFMSARALGYLLWRTTYFKVLLNGLLHLQQ